MLKLTCEFCNKTLSSKANLIVHQETAKYCLKLRGAKIKTDIICIHCDKSFSQHHHLATHIKSCKTAIKIENASLIQTIKEKTERIIELEKQLEFEKGRVDVYQKSKPSKIVNNTNCNTVNSKLSNIQITTIKPFTLEGIAELLPFYTEERFLNKLPGIIDTIIPFITLNVNGVIERNIVCTDLSRTICHLLSDKREWERDDGLTICAEIIKVFVPKMNKYMDVYNEKFKEADKCVQCASFAFMKTDDYKQSRKDFDTYYELMEELRPGFYSPASRGRGDDYNSMIKTFRDLLKPTIYVKPDKLLLK